MGWSTDHIGPMATTARGCALLLSVIAGPDPADPTASLDDLTALGADLVEVTLPLYPEIAAASTRATGRARSSSSVGGSRSLSPM